MRNMKHNRQKLLLAGLIRNMKHNTLGPDVTFPHPRSAAEQSMDTSEPKAGSSSSSAPTPAQPQAASGDPFKESDVANLVKMGFPREVSILMHVFAINWTMQSTQEPSIEFSNCAFVSGGDSWAEKMQWWCQLGHCQPFCQKPFGRFQQEEIGNFLLKLSIGLQISHSATNFLKNHKLGGLSVDHLLKLHNDNDQRTLLRKLFWKHLHRSYVH